MATGSSSLFRGGCTQRRRHAKSRSFSANLKKNAFRCFRCGVSGNHVDLWATVNNMDLRQAALTVCETSWRRRPRTSF
ncbi:MAG: hypothetical protein HY000_41425 [Planctomycetes bacterium]|nr:hypothetical protein [Planctomycetota bacterium]